MSAPTQHTPAERAVLHIVRRMQADPRLAYLIGPGSESFDLLVAAASQADGDEAYPYRESLLGRINTQPLPGIGKKAAVIDQELLARIAVYDDRAHDMDDQDDLNMLVNHFLERGLTVAEAERDFQTQRMF